MTSFGNELRRAREAQGVSLQEISDRTRIGVRQLKAIEDEQLDHLPGGIFNKSFIRQYARQLGLDEDRIVSEYVHALGVPEAQAAPPNTFQEQKLVLPDAGYPRLILTAVCLGISVAALLYVGHQISERRTKRAAVTSPGPGGAGGIEGSPPLSAPAESIPGETSGASSPIPAPISSPSSPTEKGSLGQAPSAAPTIGPVQDELRRGNANVASQPDAAPAANLRAPSGVSNPLAEGLLLQIDARKEVWLSITADGQKQWQGTLTSAKTRRVQARDSVRLTVGDAGAVALTLNGKALPAVGRLGEVKNLVISSKGLAEPAP